MEENLVRAVGAIGLALLSYGLGAIGSAVLLYLWFPRLSRTAVEILASLPLPTAVAAVILALASVVGGQDEVGAIVAATAIVFVPGLIVGWPCAFLTLRSLDRKMERAGATAQEIFE